MINAGLGYNMHGGQNNMGGAAAGAIIQGLGELGGNMINSAALAMNRDLAYRNYNWSKYGMMANLLMQNEQWNREDTAIQRRVKDLKAAGLSPVLAAGQGASSSAPMRFEAPKNDFNMPMNMISLNRTAEALNAFALTKSQTEKMDAETQRINQTRMLDLMTFPHRIKNMDAKTNDLYQNIVRKDLENLFYKTYGITPGSSSEMGRMAQDIIRILDRSREMKKNEGEKNSKSGNW